MTELNKCGNTEEREDDRRIERGEREGLRRIERGEGRDLEE